MEMDSTVHSVFPSGAIVSGKDGEAGWYMTHTVPTMVSGSSLEDPGIPPFLCFRFHPSPFAISTPYPLFFPSFFVLSAFPQLPRSI